MPCCYGIYNIVPRPKNLLTTIFSLPKSTQINMMQLLIATRHRLIGEGVSHFLERIEDIGLSPIVRSEVELFSALSQCPPDVILLDPHLVDTSATLLVRRLREANQSIGILIFSNQNETQETIKWLRAGARGYVGKRSTPEEMITAIRNVAGGGAYVSNVLAEQLALNAIAEQGPHSNLTARESEIFSLFAQGMSNKEISAMLCLSAKTVSTYKSRIFLRMGFSSMSELVMYAISHKLIPGLTKDRSSL